MWKILVWLLEFFCLFCLWCGSLKISSMPSLLIHRKNAQDICKGLYSLILATNKASFFIHSHQCMLLSQKLLETQKTLQELEITGPESPDLVPAMQELVHVLLKAWKTVVTDCSCSDKWMESVLRQGGDLKETFGEIMCELQWLCSILLKQVRQDNQVLEPVDCDGKLNEDDVKTLLTAAKKDEEDLKARLRNLQGDHSSSGESCNGECTSMQCLATQLLNKLEFRAEFQAWPTAEKKNYLEKLSEANFNNFHESPLALSVNKQDVRRDSLLGKGSFGSVHKADWLGDPYAIKMSPYGFKANLKQEIAALSVLHHPHVMHLVCCFEEERQCSYIMECMNMTLSQILENSQLSLLRRVDLMLQIAEGMNYLHIMGLVHRDLKPENILLKRNDRDSESSMSPPVAEPLWKVSDFGTTKLKMESTAYAHQTFPIGTIMFMAPEAYALEDGDKRPERFHPKKTDVYSFGLICFAVLIGEPTPFPLEELVNPSVRTFKDRVGKGMRPQLPAGCPNRLSILIEQCWNGNPGMRPNFQTICTELRYIKGCLLTGSVRRSHVGDSLLEAESYTTTADWIKQFCYD